MSLNARLAEYVYNLSKNEAFIDKYHLTLPIDIYSKTIKNQSDHKYKLILNQKVNEETISILLKIIQELTLNYTHKGN
jgi:hypothetical protein